MSSSADGRGMAVFYVDPVGGHRGMHYYDFELCPALRAAGADLALLTCDETQNKGTPEGLPVAFPFRGIYGGAPKVVRGVRYAAALLSLGGEMRRCRVRLAHFHYFHFPLADALFFKWLHRMGRRIVVTAHDVIPFNARPTDMPWLRRLYSEADRIIVHTGGGKDLLIRHFGIPGDKVTTIFHGPFLRFADEKKLPREEARRRLKLDDHARVVLFWGQIKRVKGLQNLIRAFALLTRERDDITLLIAGPEWKESFDPYLALIGELGLSERVRARIEYVPDDEVGAYFCSADVVVLPYTESYQSGVLYMAYSFARPVVASAVGGLVEAVEPGVSGLLVPSGDPVALSGAIETVLADPEMAEQMGAQGRLLAETKFGWTGIAEATMRVYAEALGQTFTAETAEGAEGK